MLESIYQNCLGHELEIRQILVAQQEFVKYTYKDAVFTDQLKFEFLVDGVLLVELKAVQEVLPVHKAQLLTYMKLLNIPLGLILNFHEIKLADGITRMILPGADWN